MLELQEPDGKLLWPNLEELHLDIVIANSRWGFGVANPKP